MVARLKGQEQAARVKPISNHQSVGGGEMDGMEAAASTVQRKREKSSDGEGGDAVGGM